MNNKYSSGIMPSSKNILSFQTLENVFMKRKQIINEIEYHELEFYLFNSFLEIKNYYRPPFRVGT